MGRLRGGQPRAPFELPERCDGPDREAATTEPPMYVFTACPVGRLSPAYSHDIGLNASTPQRLNASSFQPDPQTRYSIPLAFGIQRHTIRLAFEAAVDP